VDAAALAEIWSMIRSFDGYSVCKAHSASYAMVSFQSAFLKAHHPAEFMAAVLSNGGGYYSSGAYISEARRMGLAVLGPDGTESALRYRGRGREVRVGLMAVAGLSSSTLGAILETRARAGPFVSPADFVARAAPTEGDLVALCGAGAFDGLFGGERPSLQLRALLRVLAEQGAARLPGEGPALFAEEAPRRPTARRGPLSAEELQAEFERLGFLCGHHPLVLWGEALAGLSRSMGRDLPGLVGRRVRLAGWPVTRKEILTARGDAMEFVSFEDETAIYETVLFPEEYRSFSRVLDGLRPYVIEGVVENDQGATSLTVKSIRPLPTAKAPVPGRREAGPWSAGRYRSPLGGVSGG